MTSKYKLAIIMRTDLDMGKGKMCVQAGHASVLAVDKSRDVNVCSSDSEWCQEKIYEEWLKEGQFKIVLRASSEDELLLIESQALSAKLPVVRVYDLGYTQIPKNSLTCIAIGPVLCEDVDKITKDLKLL